MPSMKAPIRLSSLIAALAGAGVIWSTTRYGLRRYGLARRKGKTMKHWFRQRTRNGSSRFFKGKGVKDKHETRFAAAATIGSSDGDLI